LRSRSSLLTSRVIQISSSACSPTPWRGQLGRGASRRTCGKRGASERDRPTSGRPHRWVSNLGEVLGQYRQPQDVARYQDGLRRAGLARIADAGIVSSGTSAEPAPHRRLKNNQRFQCCVWTSVLSAHPKELPKVRNCRRELPHKINDVEFRTKFAKSGALERMVRRETKMAVWRASAVGSFRRRCPRPLGFSGSAAGPRESCNGR
jgi:hypothetical protein